jgi:uncharacterized protein YaaN involved in tellurite resistance
MCIICVELIKQQLTITEAEKNLGEMVNDNRETLEKLNHYRKLKYAVEELDIDELDKLLDEGTNDIE